MSQSQRKLLIIPFMLLVLSACNKEEENYDFVVSRTVAGFHSLTIESLPNIHKFMDYMEFGGTLPFCGNVELLDGDTASYPNQLDTIIYKVDYDSGCTDYDQRVKSGSMRYIFYPDGSDFDFAVWHDDVVVNYYRLKGSLAFTIEDYNDYDFKVNAYGFEVEHSNGELVITTNFSARIDYEGTGTTLRMKVDDNSGTDVAGESFRMAWEKDLVKLNACDYITTGVLKVKPNGLNWQTLDFGDGLCDSQASATAGSTRRRFAMP